MKVPPVIKRQIMILLLVLAAGLVQAQVISIEENYARNAPGIAMIQTIHSATVYVNKVTVNESRFNQLVDSIQKLDPGSGLFSAEQKLDMVVKALYKSPVRFFSRTDEYFRQQHRILSNGTGFFVTGDGYVITNCHVIERDSSFIRRKFILSTFQEVTENNIRALEASWQMTLNTEQRNLLYDVYGFIYSKISPVKLYDLRQELFVMYRIDNGSGGMARIKKPAKVIIKGKPMPGKDVAILKIDDVSNLPVLRISKELNPRIGSRVLVLGFPEPAGNNAFLASESATEPTLTQGVISAIKKSIGGWPVLQMDALIAHGSSGSPVFDDRGEVIGLATFGSLEQTTGNLASGFNFAIPLSVIREFIDSAGITPRISQASIAYNQGLQFFYTAYYRKALTKFNEALRLNGNYPQIRSLIRQAEKKIATGDDRQSFLEKNFFRIIAIFLVMAGIYVFYRQRRQTLLGYKD